MCYCGNWRGGRLVWCLLRLHPEIMKWNGMNVVIRNVVIRNVVDRNVVDRKMLGWLIALHCIALKQQTYQ